MDLRAVDRLKRIGWSEGALFELALQAIPEDQRKQYKEAFFQELAKNCLEGKTKDQPPLEGCYYLHDVNLRTLSLIDHPKITAAIFMEAMQPYYTAQNKTNCMDGICRSCGIEPPFNSRPWRPKLWDPDTKTWSNEDS